MKERSEQVAAPMPLGAIDPERFLVIAVQLGIVLATAHVLHIEEMYGFSKILPLIFFGFIVHAWLPLPYRPIFFLLLSLASIAMVLGLVKSGALVVIGITLIGICHLPLGWRLRLLLLLGAGTVLASIRTEWLPPLLGSWALSLQVLPILAAMFMFRLAVYFYDLSHEKGAIPTSQRLSYFFLLPNACFPLFPVLDYSGFKTSYYSADAADTYQKGVRWIVRGIVHLLLYRIVYQYFTPAPAAINDLAGVAQYMIASYMLYLRVSGMFHIIVGILCLFGYNMPETHRLYFLAYSFNDFWRRINIYWKDFMMKMLYYPLFIRLRKWGLVPAMIMATLATLVASWLLHSYQWFWLRGTFPLTIQDGVFWTLLGVAVAVNSVLESKFGRRRAFGTQERSLRDALVLSMKTVAMFCVMSVLWSFWTSGSVEEWISVVAVAADTTAAEIMWALAIATAAVAIGTFVQVATQKSWTLSRETAPAFGRSAAVTSVVAVGLLIAGLPQVHALFGQDAHAVMATLTSDQLNVRDRERHTAGYYEELLGTGNWSHAIWTLDGQAPKDWEPIEESSATRKTGGLIQYELIPNVQIDFKHTAFRTNQWGMRDRDYAPINPPTTYRILLLGDSTTMGAGVEHAATFESVLEERLNREQPDRRYTSYEIVNAAVGGYTVLQNAAVIEHRTAEVGPDAIMYTSGRDDLAIAAKRLAELVQEGATLQFASLQKILDRAGVEQGMTELEAVKLLMPFAEELVGWGYRRISATAEEQGAAALWMLVPVIFETPREYETRFERLAPIAREAGFSIVDLRGTYDGHAREPLRVAPWDDHPGPAGHALIADRMYQELAKDWRILFPEKSRVRPEHGAEDTAG